MDTSIDDAGYGDLDSADMMVDMCQLMDADGTAAMIDFFAEEVVQYLIFERLLGLDP